MRAQSSKRPTEIPHSVRERESFLVCDSSSESLYVSRVGNKEKESNISDLIECFLSAIHHQSLSLSVHVRVFVSAVKMSSHW